MRSSRVSAYLILIYSGILSVALIALSVMSLTAYKCGFDLKMSSVTYMLYLIYYRTARCSGEVDWRILLGDNSNISIQPNMPSETQAVFRTLIFSYFYLVFNFLAVITCLLALFGLRRMGKSKHLVFGLYFAPFIIISVAIIVLDLMSLGYYIYDYFVVLGINGLMRTMEIRNTNEMRPILEQIDLLTRSLPSIIMFAAASKCVLVLIFNVFVLFFFTPAVWRVCIENEGIIKVVSLVEDQPKPKPIRRMSSLTPSVEARISQLGCVEEEEDQDEPTHRPQPAYNPHVTTSKSRDTNV